MKTEQIIYLADIAKTHSITQTAQRFFISQQALSFSLKKLEDEFNAVFLNRSNHGVTLTPAGTAFLHKAQSILDIYDSLKDDFFSQSSPSLDEDCLPSGELRILGHTRVLEPLLMDVFESYCRKYPQIKITLQEQENIDIIEAIAQQQADCGIIFAPDRLFSNSGITKIYQIPSAVQIDNLFSDEFIICCNCNHPFAQEKNIDLTNFPDTATVQFDTNTILQSFNTPYKPANQHQFFSNNVSFHKAMLRRGLAVSVITAFEFRKLYFKHKDLIAIPTINGCKSVISIVTNKECSLSLAAQLFIRMLEKYDFYSL